MRFWIVATLALAACGDSTAPNDRPTVPRLGRYAYESEWTGTGTMTVTFASADSVAATFDTAIPARSLTMTGRAQLGRWNVDAYVLYGTTAVTVRTGGTTGTPMTFFTQYAHRIAWRTDGSAACTVQEVMNAAGGLRPCTLRYVGP